MLLGVAAVALVSVPFGLAVGAVPRELEGTLVLIGVVGIQFAVAPPRGHLEGLAVLRSPTTPAASLSRGGAIALPWGRRFAYGLALLIAARLFVLRRVNVTRHARLVPAIDGSGPHAEHFEGQRLSG